MVTEPCSIGARVRDTREATRDLFGDAGVDGVLARLDPESRAVFEANASPKWIPERIFMAWTRAVYEVPAHRDPAELARWGDRLTDRGFGFARRFALSLASPWVILRRAGALWRTEHSHGDITVVSLGGSNARMELRNHPFASDDVLAISISEAFRHIVFRCRTRWATEQHERGEDGALLVTLRWG